MGKIKEKEDRKDVIYKQLSSPQKEVDMNARFWYLIYKLKFKTE